VPCQSPDRGQEVRPLRPDPGLVHPIWRGMPTGSAQAGRAGSESGTKAGQATRHGRRMISVAIKSGLALTFPQFSRRGRVSLRGEAQHATVPGERGSRRRPCGRVRQPGSLRKRMHRRPRHQEGQARPGEPCGRRRRSPQLRASTRYRFEAANGLYVELWNAVTCGHVSSSVPSRPWPPSSGASNGARHSPQITGPSSIRLGVMCSSRGGWQAHSTARRRPRAFSACPRRTRQRRPGPLPRGRRAPPPGADVAVRIALPRRAGHPRMAAGFLRSRSSGGTLDACRSRSCGRFAPSVHR
jgi:hypothetical protein